MSAYEVGKALYSLTDPDRRAQFLADRETYLSQYPKLTADEVDMILNRRVKDLLDLGVSIYLVRTLEYVYGIGIVQTGVDSGGTAPGPDPEF